MLDECHESKVTTGNVYIVPFPKILIIYTLHTISLLKKNLVF